MPQPTAPRPPALASAMHDRVRGRATLGWWWLLGVGVTLAAGGPELPAQGTLTGACVRAEAERAEVDGQQAMMRPSRVRARLEPVRRAGHWSAAVDSLEAIFLGDNGRLTPAQRARLAAELAAMRAELVVGDGDFTARSRSRVTMSRFQLGFRSELDGGPAYVLFPATIPLVVDTMTPLDARHTICWLAMAASDLAVQFGGPGREALAAALEARVRRWDAFSRQGYSMLPHELMLNGLLPRPDLEPPRWQIIAGHPSAGVQLASAGGSLRDLERRDLLVIEPIGLLRYAADRRRYVGAALMVGMPAGGGTALGASLHIGRIGRLGWLWGAERADGRRAGALVLSTDLYRYLGAHREALDRLRDAAVARCLADAARCAAIPTSRPE